MSVISEVTKLSKASTLFGADVDEHYGVEYPPFPRGLAVGDLLFFLNHLQDAYDGEAAKQLVALRSAETISATLHFLRGRWPKQSKLAHRLTGFTKPLGSVFDAIYDLCVQTAPYIHADSPLISMNGATWANRCIKEIAYAGGIPLILDKLYPPDGYEDPEMRAKANKLRASAEKTSEDSRRYLNFIASRIQALEPPAVSDEVGYLGVLLMTVISPRVEGSTLQTRELRAFVSALRGYFNKGLNGKNYTVVSLNRRGQLFSQRTPRSPKKKLTAESLTHQTFQELNALYSNTPKTMSP